MNIYIVVAGWHNQESDIIGVYSSEDKAKESADAVLSASKTNGLYNYVEIETHGIDE